MKISLISVGKPTERFYLEAVQEYLKRIQRYSSIEWLAIPSCYGKNSVEKIITAESAAIMKLLRPRDLLVLLEIEGKTFGSVDFASWLSSSISDISGRMVFVVGGSYGVSEALKTRADVLLSLSPMTMPHELCLVFLTEQIYRAFSIIAGSSYHH
ncbi:MAG TPA: 23S rRNA (pseudouridine(1915)-N(3))-methyltransferase RlmH [Synergistales bacterium]|nr:23S rRNA (pseudouridine(1915)-N(3))-methyltransferase RlmH [Synergistales bacterium]